MQPLEINCLAWDSDFFEKKIGRIDSSKYSSTELDKLLDTGRKEGFELIYVFGDEDMVVENELLDKYNGSLVDKKVVYTKNIQDLVSNSDFIENYQRLDVSQELEILAISSGKYSRFKIDNKIGEKYFEGLYKMWIKKSVSGEMADKVFTIYDDKQLAGFVTLKLKSNVGEIGLIAVSNNVQGKGYGRLLINKCCNELSIRNIPELVVPTQLHNEEACMFYEKCGFTKKTITNIYHFWI